jgi:hypothetical protein
MRGKDLTGRFDPVFETDHIGVGVEQDLQNPVGQHVDWYRFDSASSTVDPTYDTGDYEGGGRRWEKPFSIHVVLATISQGPQYQNDRGFYTTDTLTLVINAIEMYEHFPRMSAFPDEYLLDRIVYRGKLFSPNLIYPKGHIKEHLVVARVDAEEVKPEEVVNDPQFQDFAYPI